MTLDTLYKGWFQFSDLLGRLRRRCWQMRRQHQQQQQQQHPHQRQLSCSSIDANSSSSGSSQPINEWLDRWLAMTFACWLLAGAARAAAAAASGGIGFLLPDG